MAYCPEYPESSVFFKNVSSVFDMLELCHEQVTSTLLRSLVWTLENSDSGNYLVAIGQSGPSRL